MSVNSFKLGELIELVDCRNSDGLYTLDNVKGISTDKKFIETKANMDGVSLTSYKIVRHNDFSYVADTSRRGDKIAIAYNDSDTIFLISSIYTVFRVKKTECILPEYLFIFFNRPEFDRYARFNSWGSARETFSWEDLCEIELELPSTVVQKKYVDIYNSALLNQECYERGLSDLKLVCDGYIENLRKNSTCHPIGNYVKPYNVKNVDGSITLEQGINIDKHFITPQRSNDNFYGRKIVRTGQIAYCTQLNNENVAVAYREGPDCIVSGVYDVIEILDKNILSPEYLMLWLTRQEFGRFVYWASQGTSYEFLSYDNLANYEIPIPSIEIQRTIVNIYKCFNDRSRIAASLKSNLKSICPILIKGSIMEAQNYS